MSTQFTLQDIRKCVTSIIKNLNQLKNKQYEEVIKLIIETLNEFPGKITEIISDNKETLAHIVVKQNKFDSFRLITESYMSILNCNITNAHLNSDFLNWFLLENSSNETILELSSQNGNPQIISYIYDIIIKSSESKFRIIEHRSGIFHHAAQNNQCYPIIFFYEKLQYLYKENLIIDIPNENGITPLHYACIKGSKQVIDLLLDLGVNINAKDSDNNTCLHYAVMSHSTRVVKKLLVRGADRMQVNKENQTPYDKAIEIGDNNIAQVLLIKSSFAQICSSHENVKAIKGGRNNILLLFGVIIIILLKFIYSYRMAYIYLGEFQSDLIPFIPDIMSQIKKEYGQVEKNIKEYTDLFEDGKCLVGKGCLFEITIIFISMIIDYVLLCIILYFLCFAKNIFMKKKHKNKIPSLIELYEKSKFVCVKCRNIIDSSTVHCIVCNSCVKGFDHHCFWLNTCISNLNMFAFKMFIYTIAMFFITNFIFFVSNVILVTRWSSKNYFQRIMFKCNNGAEENNNSTDSNNTESNNTESNNTSTIFTCNEISKGFWIILNSLCCIFIVYWFVTMVFPMLLGMCECRKRKNKNTFENNLLNTYNEEIDNKQ